MSRNPYEIKDQPPTLRKSVLAYVDVLGYSDLIKKSQETSTHQDTLRTLYSAIAAGRRRLEDQDLEKGTDLFIVRLMFLGNILGYCRRLAYER